MADRAKRAAALAGVIGLAVLSVPAATASMVAWSWDDPPSVSPCATEGEAFDTDFESQDWGYLVCSRFSVPRKYNPATDPPSFDSVCWHSVTVTQTPFEGDPLTVWPSLAGFNTLNVDLLWGPQPGDYPPLSLDVQTSTSPLIPSDVPSRRGPWPTLDRPTVGGTIDLITGQPLLQETDLELSFGSAVFRHTRTYTGIGLHSFHEWEIESADWESREIRPDPSEALWDWNGQGWMMGEAPLFLMDARYWGWKSDGDKPRCYFVLDAHHSIPFDMDDSNAGLPAYVAPQWMDARLDFEGTTENPPAWDDQENRWTTPPSTYYVYLYGGGVKYTIKPLYRQDVSYDMCGTTGFDLHNPPNSDRTILNGDWGSSQSDFGLGIPYLGLVTRIEDRNGNRIEIEYCDHVQEPRFGDKSCDSEHPTREEWVQSGAQKGQIRAIRLYGSGSSTAAWTLFYVYRTFRGTLAPTGTNEHESNEFTETSKPYASRQRALHAIYVYEGNVATPVDSQSAPVPSLTIPMTAFEKAYRLAAFGENLSDNSQGGGLEDAMHLDRSEVVAALEAAWNMDVVQNSQTVPDDVSWRLPNNWTHRVQYLYTEGSTEQRYQGDRIYNERNFFGSFEADADADESAFYSMHWNDPGAGRTDDLPRLIASRTQTTSVAGAGTTTQTRNWLARYEDMAAVCQEMFWKDRALRQVWRGTNLASLHDRLDRAVSENTASEDVAFAASHWPLGLLLLSERAEMPGADTTETPAQPIALGRTSDMTVNDWHANGTTADGKDGPEFDVSQDVGDFWTELWSTYISPAAAQHLVGLNEGTAIFVDRRASEAAPRVYRINRFMDLPGNRQANEAGLRFSDCGSLADYGGGTTYGNNYFFRRSLYHAPYVFYGWSSNDQTDATEIPFNSDDYVPPLGHALWITVVDEFEDEATARSGLPYSLADIASSHPSLKDSLPLSRRVVWMNAMGYILKEKVWDIRSGQLTTNSGLLTEGVYDDHARLVELRSAGWGSSANTSPDYAGRIDVYSYEDPDGVGREPSAIGVKKGRLGSTQWISQIYRDHDRPDLITATIKYATPPASLFAWDSIPTYASLPAGALMSRTDYVLGDPIWEWQGGGGGELGGWAWSPRPIYQKISFGPASPSGPSDTPRHPFAAEFYNFTTGNNALDTTQPKGALIWKAYGQVADTSASQAGDELFWDYTKYDDRGRITVQMVDAVTGAEYGDAQLDTDNHGYLPGDYPLGSQYLRQPAANDPDKPALKLTTLQWYSNQGQVRKKFPDGRYELTAYTNSSDSSEIRRGWFIKNGDGTYTPLTAGEIEKYADASPLGGGIYHWPDNVVYLEDAVPSEPIATLDMETDSAGRPTHVALNTSDAVGMAAQVNYDMFGLAGREITFDGTRTRKISNMRGQLEMVWRGTKDKHDLWGNVGSGQPDDNMLLLEKNSYGAGTDNALKLVSVRRYRHHITPQDAWDNGFDSLDSAGWLETHDFDWRGRDVLVKRYREGQSGSAGVITTTATHLDHLDRPVLVAEYDGDLPSGAENPQVVDDASTPPTAADVIQNSGGKLISLTETIYGETGKVRTTRTYDPTDVSKHTESTTYGDSRGNATWSRSPNAPVTVRVYDSQGHEVRASQFAGSAEVERTETQRDTVGNAIRVISRERVAGATGDSLDASNSVRSYRFYWYDKSNRVIAMADAGTMNAANTHVDHGGNDRARPGASTDDPREIQAAATGEDPQPEKLLGLDSDWFSALASGQGDDYQSKNLWAFELTYYDAKGNKTCEIVCNKPGVSSDDRVTDYRYDGFGQMIAKVEHTSALDVTPPRTTYSRYQNGKVVDMGTNPDADEAMFESTLPGNFQKTSLTYGAPVVVVDSNGNLSAPVSENNGFIQEIIFPHDDASPETRISFSYYPDGLIASRSVRRGAVNENISNPLVEFQYFYDELSRLIELRAAYPETLPPPGGRPVDRITRETYEYDAAGRITTATAYTENPDNNNAEEIVAQNVFAYDSMGRLLSEKQQHGGAVTSSSPVISYTWQQDTTKNIERLTGMTYPARVSKTGGPDARTLEFEYDTANSIADLLSRPSTVTDTSTAGGIGQLAAYTYSGTSRRVGASWGHGTSGVPAAAYTTVATSGVGHSGLDAMGRLATFTVKNSAGSSTPLFEALYAYSPAGDMVSRRVKQATIGSMSPDNVRSALLGYDRLGRLTDHQAGTLGIDSNGDPTISSVWRHSAWTMDTLGNLKGASGSNPVPGLLLETDRNADSTTDTLETTHGTGINNRLLAVTTDDSLLSGNTQIITPIVNDRAGNVVCDDLYHYQYDAWNRLIQVRHKGTLEFDSDGNATSGTPGDWIVHYTYDALGRLIRRQLPHNLELEQVRIEEFYYDGVRRISETLTTPLFSSGGGPVGGGGGTSSQTYTDREYVWAPPPSGYVDECICQIDRNNAVRYVIQDASYDVVAIVAPQTQSVASKVIGQYTWDPYGQVLTAEYSGLAASYNKLGHHGLFADRLDANYQGATLQPGFLTSTHLPARIIYSVRNRTYDPSTQRWLQRDPNATGQVVLGSLVSSGQRMSGAGTAAELRSLYGDGMNLYGYLDEGPVQSNDPAGLYCTTELGASMATSQNLRSSVDGQRLTFIVETAEAATEGGSVLQRFLQVMLSAKKAGAVVAAGTALLIKGDQEDEREEQFNVTLQAQSGSGKSGFSVSYPYSGKRPMTVAEGLVGLDALKLMLTKKQRENREDCFIRAARYIRSGPSGGGLRPPGKSFAVFGPGGVRVDVAIFRGVNFID